MGSAPAPRPPPRLSPEPSSGRLPLGLAMAVDGAEVSSAPPSDPPPSDPPSAPLDPSAPAPPASDRDDPPPSPDEDSSAPPGAACGDTSRSGGASTSSCSEPSSSPERLCSPSRPCSSAPPLAGGVIGGPDSLSEPEPEGGAISAESSPPSSCAVALVTGKAPEASTAAVASAAFARTGTTSPLGGGPARRSRHRGQSRRNARRACSSTSTVRMWRSSPGTLSLRVVTGLAHASSRPALELSVPPRVELPRPHLPRVALRGLPLQRRLEPTRTLALEAERVGSLIAPTCRLSTAEVDRTSDDQHTGDRRQHRPGRKEASDERPLAASRRPALRTGAAPTLLRRPAPGVPRAHAGSHARGATTLERDCGSRPGRRCRRPSCRRARPVRPIRARPSRRAPGSARRSRRALARGERESGRSWRGLGPG